MNVKSWVCGLLFLVGSVFASEGWNPDYVKAYETAKAEKKDMLILFTGSDWCAACKVLEARILSKEEFVEQAQKKFVLIMLDFPSRKENLEKIPKAIQQKNKELSESFKVKYFPSIYLVGLDEKPYAYVDRSHTGSVKQLLDHLRILQKKKVRHQAWKKALETATGQKRARILDEMISSVSTKEQEYYFEQMKEIIQLDSKNEAGLKHKYQLISWPIEASNLANSDQQEEAIALLRKILDELNPDSATKATCFGGMSRIYNHRKEYEKERDVIKELLDQVQDFPKRERYESWLVEFWPEKRFPVIPGTVTSSMHGYQSTPEDAYDGDQSKSYFCVSGPKKDDHYTIVFNHPTDLKEIKVYSTALDHGGYHLMDCAIEVSKDGQTFTVLKTVSSQKKYVQIDVNAKRIRAIRLRFIEDVHSWLHLREVVCVPQK